MLADSVLCVDAGDAFVVDNAEQTVDLVGFRFVFDCGFEEAHPLNQPSEFELLAGEYNILM